MRGGLVHDLDDLLRLWTERDPCRVGFSSCRRNDLPKLRTHLLERDPERLEDAPHCRIRLRHFRQATEAQQQMLGSDVGVAHPHRLVLSKGEHAFRTVAESCEWT